MLNASKEVILSAGAFQSPQLLMFSGAGPQAEFNKHNITCIADRPGVEQNMSDHITSPVTYEINLNTLSSLQFAARASLEYLEKKIGILTSQNADYLAWEKIPANYYSNLTLDAQADLPAFFADWPDLEYFVLKFNAARQLPADGNFGTRQPALITPISRGNISLSSASMDDAPLIKLGWLTNRTDVEITIVATRRARDFWASDAMERVTIGEEVLPGAFLLTDAQIEVWAREHAQTVYHASCTCKMGRLGDPMAVTDSRARVIGVNNLRIVDASTFPLLPQGHTQATIMPWCGR
ncbi:uncharacterized protein L3040_007656 [Drepanopeziza brunnea f. sp. 'multigermtubi']|uniref:uncharacterized protein n=1 Tax=Drepanopeziza brunnea f. sp. 'multigermtubi' TaxID=698441 RepID=UPI0023A75D33|nr:hypothetical protein L3040_007656 [Drepanopeziza brunnea f. sp. 'multigermtubi']